MTPHPIPTLTEVMDTTPSPRHESLTSDPEVAAFLASLRDEYRSPLPHEVTSTHLRSIIAASAAAPVPASVGERWGRRVRRVAAIGAVKIAIGATAAAAATGTGLAATGALPDAAQTVVADVASRIGITLPAPAVAATADDAPVDDTGERADVTVDEPRERPDTPGDRTVDGESKPGIGRGGVPGLVETESDDVPGRASEAPGHDRDDEGRPATPENRGAGEKPAEPGAERSHADERPAAGEDAGRSAEAPRDEQADVAPQPAAPAPAAGETGQGEAPDEPVARDSGKPTTAPAPKDGQADTDR